MVLVFPWRSILFCSTLLYDTTTGGGEAGGQLRIKKEREKEVADVESGWDWLRTTGRGKEREREREGKTSPTNLNSLRYFWLVSLWFDVGDSCLLIQIRNTYLRTCFQFRIVWLFGSSFGGVWLADQLWLITISCCYECPQEWTVSCWGFVLLFTL